MPKMVGEQRSSINYVFGTGLFKIETLLGVENAYGDKEIKKTAIYKYYA